MPRRKHLRHDTPVDQPAVSVRGEAPESTLIELPELTRGAQRSAANALALVRSIETIETAYDAWQELRQTHEQLRLRFSDERTRLTEQGDLLVGAVRSAGRAPSAAPSHPGALVSQGGVADFLAEAERTIAQAKASLAAQETEIAASFAQTERAIRDIIMSRVEHHARSSRPVARLMVRHMPAARRILHLQRPAPDDAVKLLKVLSERIPSRYGFLFDDSTDDLNLAPPTLYPDEGIAPAEIRPRPAQLRALLEVRAEVWPVKGVLPTTLARPGGAPVLVRWLVRGPVLEAELEDGDTFRNLLTVEEAEQLTGQLVTLKLTGRLQLELVRG